MQCHELPWDLILGLCALSSTLAFILGMAYMLRKWERKQNEAS